MIRVLSFSIAGQELAEDASNPPVDAGDQEVVIRFAEPVAFEPSEDGSPVFDNLGVGFAPYLGIGEEVTNLSISGDGRTLTATVFPGGEHGVSGSGRTDRPRLFRRASGLLRRDKRTSRRLHHRPGDLS